MIAPFSVLLCINDYYSCFLFISFLSFTLDFITGRARLYWIIAYSWSYIVVFINISTEVVDHQCVLIIFACITITTIRFSNKSLLKGLAWAWYIKFKAQLTKGPFENSKRQKITAKPYLSLRLFPYSIANWNRYGLCHCVTTPCITKCQRFFSNSFPLLLCASCLFASL